MLKCDHEAAKSQVYADLVANRLALFLGIPVLVGVPVRASALDARLRFAALRAAEVGLDVYDFTDDDRHDPDNDPDDALPLPDGMCRNAGHARAMTLLCAEVPQGDC